MLYLHSGYYKNITYLGKCGIKFAKSFPVKKCIKYSI